MAPYSSFVNRDAPPIFEFKAAGFTLPILRLLDNDIEALALQLGSKVEQAPDFFYHTPVVIDLSGLPDGNEVEFPLLVGLLRGYGMIPFGVRGGSKSQNASAEAMELAILRDSHLRGSRAGGAPTPSESPPAAERQPVPERQTAAVSERQPVQERHLAAEREPVDEQGATARETAGSLLITRPVRSGQRIYASGGDLAVIAPVSSGAELMADGNIHVYGPLRGRALAGVKGNLDARIFCQDLQAELISVAGHYRVSENIPPELRKIPVQIFLDQKILRIEKL